MHNPNCSVIVRHVSFIYCMTRSNIQMKALVVMIIFILGFSIFERSDITTAVLDSERLTASVFNPVAIFLGIRSRAESNSSSNTAPSSSQRGSDSTRGNVIINTPSPSTNRSASGLVQGIVDSFTASIGVSLKTRAPTLVCAPNTVVQGEEVIVMWACRDQAYKAVSESFDTNNEAIGSVRVTPKGDTTYTVECINNIESVENTSATCEVNMAQPALAIVATPSLVSRGGTVALSWKTKDTNSCVLTSNVYVNFEKRGTTGDAVSHPLTENTIFTLTCETTAGLLKERKLSVGVN